MAWGGRDGARTFCGAVTEEAEVKKQMKIWFFAQLTLILICFAA